MWVWLEGIFYIPISDSSPKRKNNQIPADCSFFYMEDQIGCGRCVHVSRFTFFPIPLVGEGAGDTGTKSIRFGDEDADFSKSLSLWTQQYERSNLRTDLRTQALVILQVQRLWEYYTTNSVWAWKTGGPDDSQMLGC